MTHLRSLRRTLLALGLGACAVDGRDAPFAVTARASVSAALQFDVDGSGEVTPGDVPLAGVRVSLLLPISQDTAASAVTDAAGTVVFRDLPVGSYTLRIDSAIRGDSLQVLHGGDTTVTLRPNDSLHVQTTVSYFSVPAAALAATPVGRRVFVHGLALHGRLTFSDSLFHMVDTSGYLRAMRLRPSPVVAGDSLRLRGRVVIRDGRHVLDDVTVYLVGDGLLPETPTVTTATLASGGADAALDAALLRLVDVAVVDTVTVLGSLHVTVDDGSGPATLLLDRVADPGFRPPYVAGSWDVGRRYDVLGVVTPLGAGAWVLRPRSSLDLTPR